MMKSIDEKNFEESRNVKVMLIILNVGLIVFDLVWIITLGTVWHGKPTHDKIIWEGFRGLHNFILTMSVFIVIIRTISLVLICLIQAGQDPNAANGIGSQRNNSPYKQ